MTIYTAQLNAKQHHHGVCYCTSVGHMAGFDQAHWLTFLAPLDHMVKAHKNATGTWASNRHSVSPEIQAAADAKYTKEYFALLLSRWTSVQAWLLSLSPTEDITLLCYCREGDFCHRHLIAQLIRRYRPAIAIEEH